MKDAILKLTLEHGDLLVVPASKIAAMVVGKNKYWLYIDGVYSPIYISDESCKEVGRILEERAS